MLQLYPDGWRRLLPLWFPALGLVVAPLVAWAAWRLYDKPARAWLWRAKSS
jgi:peptidoglycan/LPS O-acetylase OafA/YrhL